LPIPGVRFTLSNLLFSIAVVAANAGAVRLLYDAIEDLNGAIWPIAIIALIGSFPLFNIALIGSLLFARSRLGAFVRGRTPGPRQIPAGATFFSLHILALGAVLTIMTPDGVESYFQSTFSRSECALQRCFAVLGSDDDALNCAATEWLVFASIVYVPLMLLAWFGHKLAKRCALRLPRKVWVRFLLGEIRRAPSACVAAMFDLIVFVAGLVPE
jgi:hypothetical protein